jgi:thiamine biosynthesis lipoprotein
MSTARHIAIVLLSSACLFGGALAPPQDDAYRQARRVMGSLAEIQVYHADPALAARAMAAALDEMQRVDGLLSNYRTDSELSRMNSAAAKRPFQASPELYDFVRSSRAYFDATLGTFDPTMGPVVRAWGFFTSRPARPPAEAAAAARARSGFDKVRLDDASRSVFYTVDGLEFDPGGIGKGYAADRAAAVLRRFGITSALVSAGGSTLYGLGRPPGREGWKVAVRDPLRPAASLRFVTLHDNAVSTSGTAEKFVDVDGRRYGHIIDPRTGEPAEGMCQVTVVAPSATDSDALTKAAFLLPRQSLSRLLARREGVHVLRVEGSCAAGAVVWETPWSAGIFNRDADVQR